MIERKIDTIITDQYGNANYAYTGGGKGERDIVMKCGKVVSEPYNVLDCEWYDDCKSATHNTNWFNRNNLSVEYLDSGLKLTGGSNTGNYMPNKEGTATSITDVTEWTPSFAFEFDIVDFDNASNISVGVQSVGRNLSQLGITGATHLKVTYDGSNVNYYKDGSSTPVYTANLTTDPVYINIGVSSGYYITIKDVKIYPI